MNRSSPDRSHTNGDFHEHHASLAYRGRLVRQLRLRRRVPLHVRSAARERLLRVGPSSGTSSVASTATSISTVSLSFGWADGKAISGRERPRVRPVSSSTSVPASTKPRRFNSLSAAASEGFPPYGARCFRKAAPRARLAGPPRAAAPMGTHGEPPSARRAVPTSWPATDRASPRVRPPCARGTSRPRRRCGNGCPHRRANPRSRAPPERSS